MKQTETIVAIASAVGQGGIGIIRMSGEESKSILEEIFCPFAEGTLKSRTLRYGHIVDEEGEILDEVLAVYMKAPTTYTCEDLCEIYCHGGVVSMRRVLERCLRVGARMAEPGEFTKRAFLNGRLDLSQAEAVIDIINATSEGGLDTSLSQLQGLLGQRIKAMREEILRLLALLIANIDFPEDEVEEENRKDLEENLATLHQQMEGLLRTSRQGKLLREGLSVVILGRPNVGKSSLLNALLQEERAIVTDIAGTTRDVLEERVRMGPLTLRIMDTAGLRETEDVVENMGVMRAKKAVDQAELLLGVFDAHAKETEEDGQIRQLLKKKPHIILYNKADLLEEPFSPTDGILMSLATGEGLEALEKRILDLFWEGEVNTRDEAMLSNLRHIEAVQEAYAFVESARTSADEGMPEDCLVVDLEAAYEALGRITGESLGEDVLDRIFSEFCIGK